VLVLPHSAVAACAKRDARPVPTAPSAVKAAAKYATSRSGGHVYKADCAPGCAIINETLGWN
jgi:hypothetical protein